MKIYHFYLLFFPFLLYFYFYVNKIYGVNKSTYLPIVLSSLLIFIYSYYYFLLGKIINTTIDIPPDENKSIINNFELIFLISLSNLEFIYYNSYIYYINNFYVSFNYSYSYFYLISFYFIFSIYYLNKSKLWDNINVFYAVILNNDYFDSYGNTSI